VDEAMALLAGAGAPAAGLRWHEEYPMTETMAGLGLVLGAHQESGGTLTGTPSWWLHQIVLGDLVVGDVGFHGPPPVTGPREVEIGYDVVESLRGRGIATRACQLILEQAWRDGAEVVYAETEPGNAASQTVLRRAGFVVHGDRFAHRRPSGSARR
jgi:RimJ/RimL family protein N-acetyltransferase